MKKVCLSQISLFVVILLSLLTLSATSSWAATYYVDADLGNDSSGTGAIGAPWKTAGSVSYKTFQPDDTILFKRGTTTVYGRWLCASTQKTSEGHPITLGAYGSGSKPVITNATTLVTGWSGSGPYTAKGTGNETCLLEDGKYLANCGSTSPAPGQWYLSGSTIYYQPTTGTPGNHVITSGGAYSSLIFYQNASNYVIQDINFRGDMIFGGYAGNPVLHNITIQRCDFVDMTTGIKFGTDSSSAITGLVVQDCTFDYCGTNIYFETNGGYFDGIIFQRNTITHSNEWRNGDYPGTDRDGVSCQNLRNATIEHNEISGRCDQWAAINLWYANGFTGTNNVIRYNYVHDIIGTGIFHGGEDVGTASCTIAYNVIENCGTGPGCMMPGLPYGGIMLNRSQNISSGVYNNVIINADVSLYLFSRTDAYIVKNNISYKPRLAHVRVDSSLGQNALDQNDYYPNTGSLFSNSGSPLNFASWRSWSGWDGKSVNGDPQFVNPGTDYHLQGTSPCIGAGIYVFQPQDFLGDPVSAASVDIGAVQSQATAAPSPPPPAPTYSIAPTSQSFSAAGGSGTIKVTTSTSAAWTASSNASWITLTAGTGGIGSGQVTFTVAANSNTATRTGGITVAGQQFSVTQAAAPAPAPTTTPTTTTTPATTNTPTTTTTTTTTPVITNTSTTTNISVTTPAPVPTTTNITIPVNTNTSTTTDITTTVNTNTPTITTTPTPTTTTTTAPTTTPTPTTTTNPATTHTSTTTTTPTTTTANTPPTPTPTPAPEPVAAPAPTPIPDPAPAPELPNQIILSNSN